MATLAVQRPGDALTYANAAAGGDVYPNSGREMVHLRNASGADIDVTFASQTPCNQGVTHNAVVTVPAGSDIMVAPRDADRFNNENGQVEMTYESETGLTIAILSW